VRIFIVFGTSSLANESRQRNPPANRLDWRDSPPPIGRQASLQCIFPRILGGSVRAMVLDKPGTPLREANHALDDLRGGKVAGAAVLSVAGAG
jgi:hypothetical protein